MRKPGIVARFAAFGGLTLLLAVPGRAAFSVREGRIAFVYSAGSSATTDVYTMKPDGTDVKQLTNLGPSGKTANYESWSFDGSKIVYERYNATYPNCPPCELWIMNAHDGSGQHRLLSDPNYVDQTPSFSPRGDRVVFSRCSYKSPYPCKIYDVGINGKGLTQLTTSEDESEDAFPVYSPDGTRIAFESILRDGYLSRVYVMNADGSNLHALTPPELGGNEPSWAPDGNRILFQTYNTYIGDFSQNEEIWSIDPDGSDPKQLTRINDSHRRPDLAAPHDFAPSWAPDGDAIVFERDNGPFTKHSIIVMNARAGSTAAVFNYATRGRNEMRRRVGPLVRRDIGSGAYPRWGAAR